MESINIIITPIDQVATDHGLKMRQVRCITVELGLDYEELDSEYTTVDIRDFSKGFKKKNGSFKGICEDGDIELLLKKIRDVVYEVFDNAKIQIERIK
jgi:hypothetical protein